MRAEQVFIVSEGAMENPWFFSFFFWGGVLGKKNQLFYVPSEQR